MQPLSGKTRFLIAPLLALVASSAAAALIDDVKQLINDEDRLIAARADIAADRDAIAANLNVEKDLRADVRKLFTDRNKVQALRLLKAVDQKQVRVTLDYRGAKLVKPTAGRKNLLLDIASYLAGYDAWTAARQAVADNFEQMRAATVARDLPALRAATKTFFDSLRERLQARLQWQSDLRAMKKDVGFKATGTVQMPPSLDLSADAAEYLSDRAQWEAFDQQLEADRNNLRAGLTAGESLDSIVLTFLNDRRARRLKGLELYWDRNFMGTDIGIVPRDPKAVPPVTARDMNNDEEDDTLDQSADEAGEK